MNRFAKFADRLSEHNVKTDSEEYLQHLIISFLL